MSILDGSTFNEGIWNMRVFRFAQFTFCLCLLSCQDKIKIQEVDDVCTKMDDLKFMEFCYKSYDVNKDSKVSMSEAAAIKEMEIGKGISSLKGIEYFTSLTMLSCANTSISSLNLANNTQLSKISCKKNVNLTSLVLPQGSTLTYLNCSENSLTSLDLSKNKALTYLDCSLNKLTSLDISNNKEISHLDCGGNKISSIDVSKNTALTSFYCIGNKLSSLDVSRNTELTSLECTGNSLSSLDLSNNHKLRSISCSENQFTSLDISKTDIILIDKYNGTDYRLYQINNSSSKHDLTLFLSSAQYEHFINNYGSGSETEILDKVYNKFRIIIKRV